MVKVISELTLLTGLRFINSINRLGFLVSIVIVQELNLPHASSDNSDFCETF